MLTSAEVAVFLRCSIRTLEGMRRDGSGPKYTKLGSANRGTTNRRCLYIKKDLDSWLEESKVTSVTESTFG